MRIFRLVATVRAHHALANRHTRERARFHDPVTGDALTCGEEVSWVLQGVIRRWSVFMAIVAFTVWAWAAGRIWAQPITDVWNLFASFWAMALETVVGISMFSQTRRDALLLRKIHRLEQRANLHWSALESHLGMPCPFAGSHDCVDL